MPPKAKLKKLHRGNSAVGKVIAPTKQGMSSGKVFTPEEMRKEQLKRNKKPSRGSTGYSGANKI